METQKGICETLALWKRELLRLLKRSPRNPPCPLCKVGLGGDFSDSFPNRYYLAKILRTREGP
jgi:hypothetical protein